MAGTAQLNPEPAPVIACTVSRDVQNFDLLIEDMEAALGERWGDLSFEDALNFFPQPDAESLEFIALAVDGADEDQLEAVEAVIRGAQGRGIKVILIADQVGPAGLHQLLRMGAEDFVPYPLPEGALNEAIERIRRPVPPPAQPPAPPGTVEAPAFRAGGGRDGVILPVHGLAGGVGGTTFAVNLAWELATLSKTEPARVALLDFDLQFGSVATSLDLPRRDQIFDILSDVSAIDAETFVQSMLSYNERLHVFTSPPDMLPLDFISSDDIGRLLGMARENFDYVVIDLPKTIVQWTETVLSQAHVYFALLELDMRSAQNALRLVRALKAENLPWEKLRFALNRAPGFTDLSGKSRARRLAESLSIDLELMLPEGARQVTQSNDHGAPLALSAPKNPLRKEIQKIARQISDTNAGKAGART